MIEEHQPTIIDQRKESKERRARNRAYGLAQLRKLGVLITSRNQGAHLIVRKGKETIDYWPGTGKWRARHRDSGVKFRSSEGRGIQSLTQRLAQIEVKA